MKNLFYKLPENVAACFKGRNLLWQIAAIVLTYLLVVTGADWAYFQLFQGKGIYQYLFLAGLVGFLVPVILPIIFLLIGVMKKNGRLLNAGWGIAQAEILAWCLSAFYKFFTGRAHPSMSGVNTDITHVFNFGLDRGGIFWGWPSSHTIVAFAMASAIAALFPEKMATKVLVFIYAFYIGLSVAGSFHWFSDFIAGAIIGAIVGTVVGRSFRIKPFS